jgi:hypothetical protein
MSSYCYAIKEGKRGIVMDGEEMFAPRLISNMPRDISKKFQSARKL